MKKITSIKQLNIGEDYLVFINYDYSPSGFDVCKYHGGGNFETQGNGQNVSFDDDGVEVYELPIPDSE